MKWIDSQEPFDALMERAATQPLVAIDTEADSLHSYFDKTCLIQITTGGEDYVIDPLTKISLARFGELLANPAITKIFHGGDYDLRILNRDFGFTVSNLIDTMVSAQLLGYSAMGLAALLDRHFGVQVNKAHQRADWSMRPLSPEMLAYASMDTHYLTELAAIMRRELEEKGRWEWALEEFSRLEQVRFREKDEEDGEPFRKLKGIGGLERRQLGVLAELHTWRDGLARKADRPPFKIIGNDSLIEIARLMPQSREELEQIKAVSRFHSTRYGNDIVRMVRVVMERPEDQLPEKSEPKTWIRDKALEGRIDRLKKVRDRFASELRIDGSMLAPRHVLAAIATNQPQSLEELDQIPAMRNWQKQLLGPTLIEVTRKKEQLKLL
jgi:ribonuclease D